MKIFIGSSRESIDLVREIGYWLEEKGHEALPWDKPGLFMPGDQTFLNLIAIAGQVDGALFVFGEDDKVWYRGDGATQPRDNVLVEYGLFVGKLGPRKAVICRVGNPKHAGDLLGLTFIDLSQHRMQQGRIALTLWANSLGSVPQDPAVIKLVAQIHELKNEKEQLEQKISFEVNKSNDLERLLND
jgi:predicted nucleotide-binding protein